MLDILLPFYGDPRLLQVAVRSVLDQHSDSWRLIIVDDCYPDPEVERWCASLQDDRVTYFRNESNLGANRNYDRALRYASAEYVVMMGADDVMLPNYVEVIERVIGSFDRPTVVQPGVSVIDETGRATDPLVDRVKSWLTPRGQQPSLLCGERLATRLLLGNWTYFPALCWHRETIMEIGFRKGFDVVQDLSMLLDVTIRGGRFVYDPELAFLYRRHAASDSGVRTLSGHRFTEERRVFAEFAHEMQDVGWRRASKAARLHLTSRMHSVSLLPHAVAQQDAASFRQLVRHSLST